MDTRDKNNFEVYVQAVCKKLDLEYSDTDLYSSCKFLLDKKYGSDRRFFDVKTADYSFFQENKEIDERFSKETPDTKYSIPILSTDPIKNLSFAREMIDRKIVNLDHDVTPPKAAEIFDNLDKDLTQRSDWKQFWEKMEKQAPDKKQDIDLMQKSILNSYRFRVISMLTSNFMAHVSDRAKYQPMVLRLVSFLQKESNRRLTGIKQDNAASELNSSSSSILKAMAEKTSTPPTSLVATSTRFQKQAEIEELMLQLENKQNETIHFNTQGQELFEHMLPNQQFQAQHERNMINTLYQTVMDIRSRYEKPKEQQGAEYQKRLKSLDELENQCFKIVSECIKGVESDTKGESKQIISHAYDEMQKKLKEARAKTTFLSSLRKQLDAAMIDLNAAYKSIDVVPSSAVSENKNETRQESTNTRRFR